MVHVNGKKVGGNDAVTKFIAYVSPYFVVSNGGAYTKHIYAASQRIASKLGNEDGFGADPRRVEQAGGKKISDFQKDKIGARFEELGYRYNGNNQTETEKDSTMDSEEEEKLIFFYHPDHLGSTSYVTDADGNIAQHIEYIPYGEVFVEERNSQFSTNFLFNAKELDNETGLYYYGARYLDPTGAMWLSVDPMWEKYAGMSPYNYCMGNPVVMVDPDGRFSVNVEDAEHWGLTKDEVDCFTNLIDDISKVLYDENGILDKELIGIIRDVTGCNDKQILEDFSKDKGPSIRFTSGATQTCNDVIFVNVDAVKYYAASQHSSGFTTVGDKDFKTSAMSSFLMVMDILHEYAHYGDYITNGELTGQTHLEGNKVVPDLRSDGTPHRPGKQGQSRTGHRGDDLTLLGFGCTVYESGTNKPTMDRRRYKEQVETAKHVKKTLNRLGIKWSK